jgi:hypothetical protein
VGGLNIALQDELDANEKMFVGGQHLRDLADLGGKVLKLFFGEAETYHEALHGQNMKFRWFNGNRMNT